MSVKTRKYGNSRTVYFDWCIIPHTTVCKACVRLRRYTACCSTLYLQHGGSNYCRQNDVTVTPRTKPHNHWRTAHARTHVLHSFTA